MIALLDAVVVLVFPAVAVWAVRAGGPRRLWLAAGGGLAGVWILALALSSLKFGNRLAAHQGYGRTALLTVLMATLMLGLPIVAGTLSVHATRARIRRAVLLYLLAVAAAFVVLLFGTGLGVYLVQTLVERPSAPVTPTS
jgi:hypothetical protein